jgi:hypothetical protein
MEGSVSESSDCYFINLPFQVQLVRHVGLFYRIMKRKSDPNNSMEPQKEKPLEQSNR